MIAGAAAGILLALVGKNGMEKALVKAKLPLLVRKLVTDNAVKRGLSRQREEIEKAIIKALADPANGFPRGCARACRRRLARRWNGWPRTPKCRFVRDE